MPGEGLVVGLQPRVEHRVAAEAALGLRQVEGQEALAPHLGNPGRTEGDGRGVGKRLSGDGEHEQLTLRAVSQLAREGARGLQVAVRPQRDRPQLRDERAAHPGASRFRVDDQLGGLPVGGGQPHQGAVAGDGEVAVAQAGVVEAEQELLGEGLEAVGLSGAGDQVAGGRGVGGAGVHGDLACGHGAHPSHASPRYNGSL